MRLIYAWTFCLLWPCLALCQSERIKDLEKLLPTQKGETFLNSALTLAEWYSEEGFHEQAAERAEQAADAAKELKLNAYAAIALNARGKALAKTPGKRPAPRKKAWNCFEESNKLTTDKALRLDNLQQLRDLAMQLDRRKELDKIVKDIAILEGEHIVVVEAGKAKAEEEALKMASENKELNAEVSNLATEREKLRKESTQLKSLVKKKEAAIANMTAEQIKQQLLVSEQSRLLDSLAFTRILDSMQLAQKEMLVQQKDIELREKEAAIQVKESQQKLLMAGVAFVFLLAAGLFHRYLTTRKHNAVLEGKNRIISEERQRSEDLLLNILPAAIADELKLSGTANARHYDNATVLFTDFKGFSSIAKKLSADQLVKDLHHAFMNFDQIIGRHGLEKIKTIGDAYMCAGGIPAEDGSHPRQVVQAALEIQEFLKQWNKEKKARGEAPFEARIGIHTGPIVAGVVGSKKFAYDIWGDTVNVAARMEQGSEPGRVNISASTFAYVKDNFSCEYRGKVPAKNVGEVEMYFVLESN